VSRSGIDGEWQATRASSNRRDAPVVDAAVRRGSIRSRWARFAYGQQTEARTNALIAPEHVASRFGSVHPTPPAHPDALLQKLCAEQQAAQERVRRTRVGGSRRMDAERRRTTAARRALQAGRVSRPEERGSARRSERASR
jgi:hypothetical protein